MEIAMLMIGLLLGGCVSFCILGCMRKQPKLRRITARYTPITNA